MRLRSGGVRQSENTMVMDAPVLPEYEAEPADPDFDADMAEAIEAARRVEFAALSDLNDGAEWGDSG
jgi:hypothetical protein